MLKSRPSASKPANDGAAVPGELWQQAREEDGHLRVAEIAEHALAESRSRREPRSSAGERRVVGRQAGERRPQRLEADEHEVGGARELDRREHGLRSREQRGHAGCGRDGPDRLAAGDTSRGGKTRRPTAHERVADREGRVLAGRDDHEDGDAEERGEVVHHAGECTARANEPDRLARCSTGPARSTACGETRSTSS